MDPILVKQVSRDEGRSATVYKDSLGLFTIGDGILVDPSIPHAGLKQNEMDFITANRLAIAEMDAREDVGEAAFARLSPPRQRAIINMAYNLGDDRLEKFHMLIASLRAGDFKAAASNMKDSLWYRQVGKRGERLVKQMLTGVDQP